MVMVKPLGTFSNVAAITHLPFDQVPASNHFQVAVREILSPSEREGCCSALSKPHKARAHAVQSDVLVEQSRSVDKMLHAPNRQSLSFHLTFQNPSKTRIL